MKNKILIITALVLALALISLILILPIKSTGKAISSDNLEKVKIGYRGHLFYLPAYVAEAKGYYEEEGLDVELVKFDSTNQLVEAVINGNIDAGVGGVNSLVPLTIEGKNSGLLKIFSLGYYSREFDALLVRKNSDINSLSDLKGKTISTLPGSTAMTWMNLMIEEEGLKNVNIVQTAPSQQLNALSSGSVDAIFVLEPLVSIGEAKDISRVLVKSPITTYFMDGLLFETSVFSTDFVNKNPETAEKITRAIDRVIIFINSNPEQAKTYYSEFTPVEDSLEAKLPITKYQTSLDMDIKGFQDLADKAFGKDLLEKRVEVDSMFYRR